MIKWHHNDTEAQPTCYW